MRHEVIFMNINGDANHFYANTEFAIKAYPASINLKFTIEF